QAGERRSSRPIAHGLDVNDVAIIMAVEVSFAVEGDQFGPFVYMGDLEILQDIFGPFFPAPLMLAAYDPNNPSKEFEITLKDRRPVGSPPLPTLPIRWWAIPKTLDQPDVTVPPGEVPPTEFLLARLFMSPGI